MLALVLEHAHRRERGAHIDDGLRRGDAGAHAVSNVVERRRDGVIPCRVQPERGIDGALVAGPVGELGGKLGARICLVEAEDLARRVGAVAETIPDFALRVLVTAEQDLLGIAFGRAGDEDHRRFGLGKPGQVVEMAVRPVWIVRIGVADHFRRGGNGGDAPSALPSHLGHEALAPVSMMLMVVVHGFLMKCFDEIAVVRAAAAQWPKSRAIREARL